jgi:hypothetical protein
MLFREAVPENPLRAYTKADGAELLQFMGKRRTGQKTVATTAGYVNALFNVADKAGMIENNPFDLSVEVTDSKRRTPGTKRNCGRYSRLPCSACHSRRVFASEVSPTGSLRTTRQRPLTSISVSEIDDERRRNLMALRRSACQLRIAR